jgi:hypothetical protein
MKGAMRAAKLYYKHARLGNPLRFKRKKIEMLVRERR